MTKLNNNEINNALNIELGKEKVSDIRKMQTLYNDNDDKYNDNNDNKKTTYSFEIKEDFETLKTNLLKSMKNGIIRALAHDEKEILRDGYKADYFPVYDENHNLVGRRDGQVLSCGYEEDRGLRTLGYSKNIYVFEDEILLVDAVEDEWEYNSSSVRITPSENGGCLVDGDVHLLTSTEINIFSGVRKEMTYVPDTYMSYKEENGHRYQKTYFNDELLRSQEDNKITWQSLKNYLGNEHYSQTPKDFIESKRAKMNAVLNYIDSDKDKPMDCAHTGVTYHHHIHNCGIDGWEHEYIYIQNDYPSDCLHGGYEHNGTMSYWGCRDNLPSHWSESQADQYLTLRIVNRYDISEKLFDSYLKSGQNNLIKYLKEKHKEVLLDTHKNIEQAKQRVRKHQDNTRTTPQIQSKNEKVADISFKNNNAKHGSREDR